MINHYINQYQDKIEQICRAEDVSYLALFGSFARQEEQSNSDIDMLYDFDDTVSDKKSLMDVVHLKQKLEDVLKRPVDVVSRSHIKPRLKPYIMQDLIPIYEKR